MASVRVSRRTLRADRSTSTVAVRLHSRGDRDARVRVRLVTADRHRLDARVPAHVVVGTRWTDVDLAAGTVRDVRLRLRPAIQRLLRRSPSLRVRIVVRHVGTAEKLSAGPVVRLRGPARLAARDAS